MDAISGETAQRSGLAKHRVLLELGQGGMSNVYLAVARGPGDFHKLVVLKVLRADLAQDPVFRSMALGEAKIAARLNHPNVVQTYEVLNEGERPVIVMEYLEGQSLSAVLSRARGGTLTLAMALQILVDALAGLHHAHELSDYDGEPFGLVHRDFTPHNIFLGYDGHIKIIDFGIAKSGAAESDSHTGTLKGKVRYMSPEQVVGAPPIDRRADIFAAGMVLWELATRESPWKDATEMAIIHHVINDELPSMRVTAPEVPPAIERICTKAIQFNRENRYATAAEMSADIERVLGDMNERLVPRDLGRVVSEHFADVRATTKRVIEAELARSDLGEETHPLLAIPVLQLAGAALPAQTPVAATTGGEKARPPAWVLALALVLAGALALALTWRHGGGGATAATPTEAPVPSAPVSAIAPPAALAAPGSSTLAAPSALPATRQVQIDLRATPRSAVLYFDDEPLPTNPASTMRKADGTLHTVRAKAPGYLPRAVEIVVDKGADLVLNLEREPSGSRRPLSGVATSAASSHGSPPSPSDCNPPFYVNADGIKKFKPQCL